MKTRTTLFISILFILGLMACQLSPDLNLLLPTRQATVTVATPPANDSALPVTPSENILNTDASLSALFERVNPGVVYIIVTTPQGIGSGSGFVYDTAGHILTNYHVVEGATSVEVDFPNGVKVSGDVLATDLDSDIAVVKVNVPAADLVPLPLGDSDALKVGQMVVAIGNPFQLTSSMTLGIVSAKGRILDSIRTAGDQSSFTAGDIIQTDAAINPGNSGGPLLNLTGEVIGINRAIRTTGTSVQGDPLNSGIGFAVSINIVKRVVPYLIRDGHYDYPYLGISSTAIDLTLADWKALGFTQTSGSYITSITPGGPADQAGLVGGTQTTSIQGLFGGGDLIIAADGKPVHVYGDLISYIFSNKVPGDQLVLTIIRDGAQQEVTITLGARP